jgi:hypothetical protein
MPAPSDQRPDSTAPPSSLSTPEVAATPLSPEIRRRFAGHYQALRALAATRKTEQDQREFDEISIGWMSLLCTEVVPIPRLRPDGTIEVVQRDASLEDRVNAIDMYFAYTLAVRPRPHEKGDRLIAQHVHRMGIMVAISRRLPDGARWIEQLVAAAWDELGRDPEPLVHPTGPRPPDLVARMLAADETYGCPAGGRVFMGEVTGRLAKRIHTIADRYFLLDEPFLTLAARFGGSGQP